MSTTSIQIDIHLDDAELQEIMREEVRAGLSTSPKRLSPKYFYDERGSELFELITRQPEYYQTRTERQLLEELAGDLVHRHRFEELLELGSGSSEKTHVLLDPMHNEHHLRKYIPFDVSPSMIHRVSEELTKRYPELQVHGVIGDFTRHLPQVPRGQHRLILLLGSTIGNFEKAAAIRFLTSIADTMSPTDRLLLGTDLVKDAGVLEAAYNDARTITVDFNRNILRVINRQLDADFPAESYEHVAFYNETDSRIEMWLRSPADHEVVVRGLELTLSMEKDELIRTELSHKYTGESVAEMVEPAGMEIEEWYTDSRQLFGLSLLRPTR